VNAGLRVRRARVPRARPEVRERRPAGTRRSIARPSPRSDVPIGTRSLRHPRRPALPQALRETPALAAPIRNASRHERISARTHLGTNAPLDERVASARAGPGGRGPRECGSAGRRGWRGERARTQRDGQDVPERRRAGHPQAGVHGLHSLGPLPPGQAPATWRGVRRASRTRARRQTRFANEGAASHALRERGRGVTRASRTRARRHTRFARAGARPT
jgi:hypothetical protein